MNRAAQFKKVTHVIFDLDGVLLDTERLYTLGVQNVVIKYGKTFDWTIKSHIMGLTGQEASVKIVELLELPISPEEFYKLAKEQYAIVMQDAQLMPGAEKLARHLHKNKIPIAIATSSAEKSYLLKSAKHKDFFSIFSHVVCGGTDPDVREGKPKPDIFLVCASRFPDKPHPEKCLVFEDSPNGVAAAISAGMQAVMLPDENVPENLRTAATIVVTALDATPLERFGLPALHS